MAGTAAKLQSSGSVVLLLCTLAVCLVLVRGGVSLQDKSDNEIADAIPKLSSPYGVRSTMDNIGDEAYENRALMNKIVSLLERKKFPPNWIIPMLSAQHKRQIRYQQCYFNPISCF